MCVCFHHKAQQCQGTGANFICIFCLFLLGGGGLGWWWCKEIAVAEISVALVLAATDDDDDDDDVLERSGYDQWYMTSEVR